MNTGTTLLARPGTGPTRSFTRLELLAAVAVVLLLAGLGIFVLSRRRDDSARCLDQLRTIGFGYLSYLKDYNFWMPCAGNKPTEMYDRALDGASGYEPTYELPWFRSLPAQSAGFPYWYEALQRYIDPSATVAAARKSYKDRTGKDIDPANPQPALRVEQARLMRVLACPGKPNAPVGYGYHYTAPFGNSFCYPNARDKFTWYERPQDAASNTNPYDHPVHYSGDTLPIPILWYEQYIHSSTLTRPSGQVILCDTGLSTPETRDLADSRLWRETEDNNDEGYVRFPLMKGYWPPYNKVPAYRSRPWRPMPRHGGKAACLFPDGSARTIPIQDLCSPGIQWGDPGCLFDNRTPNRPPVDFSSGFDVTQMPELGRW